MERKRLVSGDLQGAPVVRVGGFSTTFSASGRAVSASGRTVCSAGRVLVLTVGGASSERAGRIVERTWEEGRRPWALLSRAGERREVEWV